MTLFTTRPPAIEHVGVTDLAWQLSVVCIKRQPRHPVVKGLRIPFAVAGGALTTEACKGTRLSMTTPTGQ